MSSPWTHSICDECWQKREPNRVPVRAVPIMVAGRCCYCGKEHRSGIYVREHPADMECNGLHGDTA